MIDRDDLSAALEALSSEPSTTAAHSLEHCAFMIQFWLKQLASASSVKDRIAISNQQAQWEQRKSAAQRDLKVDLMRRILERSKGQEAAAAELYAMADNPESDE